MDYQFECVAGHKEVISMPIKEYTSENHFCKVCGGKLVRPISSLVCGYQNSSGFFGKRGQHD